MTLPDFVAKQLHQVPSAHASDVDIYKLADTVDAVRVQLASTQNVLKSVLENQATLTDTMNLAISAQGIYVQKAPLNNHVSGEVTADGVCGTDSRPVVVVNWIILRLMLMLLV